MTRQKTIRIRKTENAIHRLPVDSSCRISNNAKMTNFKRRGVQ